MKEVLQVTLLKLVMRSGTLQYEKQAVNLMGRDEPGKRWTCLFHQHFICARIWQYKQPWIRIFNLLWAFVFISNIQGWFWHSDRPRSRKAPFCETGLASYAIRINNNKTFFFFLNGILTFPSQSLVKFANVHLSSLGWPVTSLESDFSDGVRLILLTGCLEVISACWWQLWWRFFRVILFRCTYTSWNQPPLRRKWKTWTLHSGSKLLPWCQHDINNNHSSTI